MLVTKEGVEYKTEVTVKLYDPIKRKFVDESGLVIGDLDPEDAEYLDKREKEKNNSEVI